MGTKPLFNIVMGVGYVIPNQFCDGVGWVGLVIG